MPFPTITEPCCLTQVQPPKRGLCSTSGKEKTLEGCPSLGKLVGFPGLSQSIGESPQVPFRKLTKIFQ